MATIVTRSGKGSPLTNNEVDANFNNLNTEVGAALPKAGGALSGAVTTNSTFDGRDVAADGVTADAALPKAGGAMTGAITTNSTFDGRDVATDGTKLDGVEASADVTDTANVTSAGALMDSELTSIASVKALNQGLATGNSPTFVNVTATSLDISGNIDIDGVTNLDVLDVDGAVNMATTALVTGVLTTTAATVFNGGFASNGNSTVGGTFGVTGANAAVMSLIAPTDNATFEIRGGNSDTGVEEANIVFYQNNAAKWQLGNSTDNGFKLYNYAQSNYAFTVNSTGAATFASSVTTGGAINNNAGSIVIGTTSLSQPILQFLSSTSGANTIHFGDGSSADAYRGYINYSHSNDRMEFATAGAERMRIDSSGNLLVGGTAYEGSTSSNASSAYIASNGFISANVTNDFGMQVNRTGTDGTLFNLRKNGADAASIGLASGFMVIGSLVGSDAHVIIGNGLIQPATVTGSAKDNAIDIGGSSNRFKNLYLSGTATMGALAVGGTNTFTSKIVASAANGTAYSSNPQLRISGGGTNYNRASIVFSDDTLSDGKISYAPHNIVANRLLSLSARTTESDFVITGAGNVGIGTNSPAFKLHQSGTGLQRFQIDATDNNVNGSGVYLRVLNSGSVVSQSTIAIDNVGNLKFFTGTSSEAERVRIDASGRVGIGTTSPATYGKFAIRGGVTVNAGSTSLTGTSFSTSDAANATFWINHASATTNLVTDASMAFYTASGSGVAKRVTINTSGNLLVGGTVSGAGAQSGIAIDGGESDSNIFIRHANGTGSGSRYMAFTYNTSVLGSVTQNGTSQVLFNVSSDQRLKENIADADDAGSKIDAIQVRKYDWKADGSHQDYGMIAQELQAVAPEAVSGDADSEEMMGVDYSKLVPLMLKEIQSLRNRVAQLEG